jgi:hypothetical protein
VIFPPKKNQKFPLKKRVFSGLNFHTQKSKIRPNFQPQQDRLVSIENVGRVEKESRLWIAVASSHFVWRARRQALNAANNFSADHSIRRESRLKVRFVLFCLRFDEIFQEFLENFVISRFELDKTLLCFALDLAKSFVFVLFLAFPVFGDFYDFSSLLRSKKRCENTEKRSFNLSSSLSLTSCFDKKKTISFDYFSHKKAFMLEECSTMSNNLLYIIIKILLTTIYVSAPVYH